MKTFELTPARAVIVPGNHDVTWTENAYDWKPARSVDPSTLKPGSFVKKDDVYLVRKDDKYPERFRDFSEHLYHPLIQLPYPLQFDEQVIPYTFDDTGIQFLAFNSAWETDEWFKKRAGIRKTALMRGLEEANNRIKDRRKACISTLRIAVWHHPITGDEKMPRDFVEHLRKEDFRLALHGHVHELRAELIGYLYERKVHVAGAGSFSAPTRRRPNWTPCLYNLIEVTRDHKQIRVHTRCRQTPNGPWTGHAVWPGDGPTNMRTYYEI